MLFYCFSFVLSIPVIRLFENGNPTLLYRDGILRLQYWHLNRSKSLVMEIVFLCDVDAGVGTPSLDSDSPEPVIFIWRTAYACLPEAVPCSVIDPQTGLTYDLSRFAFISSSYDIHHL